MECKHQLSGCHKFKYHGQQNCQDAELLATSIVFLITLKMLKDCPPHHSCIEVLTFALIFQYLYFSVFIFKSWTPSFKLKELLFQVSPWQWISSLLFDHLQSSALLPFPFFFSPFLLPSSLPRELEIYFNLIVFDRPTVPNRMKL